VWAAPVSWPVHWQGLQLDAYTVLTAEELWDYEQVKTAILYRCEVNKETHRHHFHQEKKPEESYRAWVCRIAVPLGQVDERPDHECVREVITMEQILMGVPEEMGVWLKGRKPTPLDELGMLADVFPGKSK